MQNLSDEVKEELEVLAAIYMDDFLERPPVWNFPSFAIKLSSTNSSNNAKQIKLTGKSFLFSHLSC